MDRKPIRCCPWFQPIEVALIVGAALAAVVLAYFAWRYALFGPTQVVYTVSGRLSTSPSGQVLQGATSAIAMTLPNNLLEYIGGFYHVECTTPFAHSVSIALGSLVTTWDGSHTVATCTGGPGSGFSYYVVNPFIIRIVSPTGITFS